MTPDVLLPWIHPTGEGGERKSMQTFQGNGTTGPWEFNFAGGYIERAHVKAYRYDPVLATSHPQVLTFMGSNQITTSEPIPANQYLVLYRDTPKDAPLVDYNEGAVLNEKNLDATAQQAVFATAEMADRFASANAASDEAIQHAMLAVDAASAALSQVTSAVADAAASANNAAAAASSAEAAANQAVDTANAVDAKAQEALDNALAAVNTANAATSDGAAAVAQTALDNSIMAVNTANNAAAAASSAEDAANTAAAAAAAATSEADAKATQAQTDAAAAVLTANEALAAAGNVDSKADIDSPFFTGAPKAPTPPSTDTSNRLATTGYVKSVVTQGYAPLEHTHAGTYAPASHAHASTQILDASAVGRAVLTAADAATARAAIGAGTGSGNNLTLGHSAGQAKPGDWKPHIDYETTGQLPYSRLTDVPTAAPYLPGITAVGAYALVARGLSPVLALETGSEVSGSSLVKLWITGSSAHGLAATFGGVPAPTLPGTWRILTASRGTSTNAYGISLAMRIA